MNEEDNGNVHLTSVVGQGDWWQMVNLHFIDLDASVSTRACGLLAKVWPWPSTWPHGLWSTRVRKVRSQLDRSHTTHNILQANPKFKWWTEGLHSQKMKDSSLCIASILCDDCFVFYTFWLVYKPMLKWQLKWQSLVPSVNFVVSWCNSNEFSILFCSTSKIIQYIQMFQYKIRHSTTRVLWAPNSLLIILSHYVDDIMFFYNCSTANIDAIKPF